MNRFTLEIPRHESGVLIGSVHLLCDGVIFKHIAIENVAEVVQLLKDHQSAIADAHQEILEHRLREQEALRSNADKAILELRLKLQCHGSVVTDDHRG